MDETYGGQINPKKWLGEHLRINRKLKAMTQKDVARELNVPYQTYQKYEYDLFLPSPKRLELLSKILDFSFPVYIRAFY